jgi:hypothetical protein
MIFSLPILLIRNALKKKGLSLNRFLKVLSFPFPSKNFQITKVSYYDLVPHQEKYEKIINLP